MGKMTKFIVVMSGLVLLFYFTGLMDETAGGELLSILLNPNTLSESSFAAKILLGLSGVLAVGGVIVVGYLTKDLQTAVMAPVSIYLFNLLFCFSSVAAKIIAVSPVFGILTFSPILLLFIITILDYWRGTD